MSNRHFSLVQMGQVAPTADWTFAAGHFVNTSRADLFGYHPSNGSLWVGRNNGTAFAFESWGSVSPASGWQFVTGDFLGSGRSDVLGYHPSNGTLWVAENTGTGFALRPFGTVSPAAGWQLAAGRFTGGEKADLFGYHPSNGTLWVGVSTGSSFAFQQWGSVSPADGWQFVAGDFAGNGRTTVVGYHAGNGTLWLAENLGTSFALRQAGTVAPAGGWQLAAGFFSNQRKADLFGYHPSNGTLCVGQINGTSFTFSTWGKVSPESGWRFTPGTFDAGVVTDLAGYHPSNGSLWVATSMVRPGPTPIVVLPRESAWLMFRDLARRANGHRGIICSAMRSVSPVSATLDLHHNLGLQLGALAKLTPAARREHTLSLLQYIRTAGMDGVEALVLNASLIAAAQGDRALGEQAASIFDDWRRRRGGGLLTGYLPVLDPSGRFGLLDPAGLGDAGLRGILGSLATPGSILDRAGNFGPGGNGIAAPWTKYAGGTPGVDVSFFGKGGLIEVTVTGSGFSVIAGTSARGAVIGAALGGPVGATVGAIVGGIAGAVGAFYQWLTRPNADAIVRDVKAMAAESLAAIAKAKKEYEEYWKKQAEEQTSTTTSTNDDGSNDSTDPDSPDSDPDNPDNPDNPDGGDQMPGWDGDDGNTVRYMTPADMRRIAVIVGEFRPKGPTNGTSDNQFKDMEGAYGDVDLTDILLDPALDPTRLGEDGRPPRLNVSWREARNRFTSDGSNFNADGLPSVLVGAIGGTTPPIGGDGGGDPAASGGGLYHAIAPTGQALLGKVTLDSSGNVVAIKL